LKLGKIIANMGWLFGDRVLRMGGGLFVGVWLARYLGTEQFGTLNYATAFVALFTPIATLGLDALVIRDVLQENLDRKVLLGTTFFLKLIGGLACIVISVLSIYLFRANSHLTIKIVAIMAAATVFQSFDTIDFWFQSQVQSKYTVVVKNAVFIIVSLLKVALITTKASLISFVWVGLLEVVLSAIGLISVYQFQGLSIFSWRWSSNAAINLLTESWPLILSGLSIMIYVQIDRIMLGQMIGNRAVGIYSAATRISEIWYFIPTAIISSVAPAIYEAKKISEELYYRRIKKLMKSMFLFSVILSLLISLFSKYLVVQLFGINYLESVDILSIHIWASVFVFLGVSASPWFIAEQLTAYSFYTTATGAIMNILINLVLIPNYGGVGAAIATVISYAFASVLLNILPTKTRKIFNIQIGSIFMKT
jgi:polysaccharide transporter, PST family